MSNTTLALGCTYTGPDMKSHFKELRLPHAIKSASGITYFTDLFPVQGWRSALLEPGRRDWHVNPTPTLSVFLGGSLETTLGDGVKRKSVPGTMGLSLDALGRGHRTEVFGPAPAFALLMTMSREQLDLLSKILIGWPADMLLPPVNWVT